MQNPSHALRNLRVASVNPRDDEMKTRVPDSTCTPHKRFLAGKNPCKLKKESKSCLELMRACAHERGVIRLASSSEREPHTRKGNPSSTGPRLFSFVRSFVRSLYSDRVRRDPVDTHTLVGDWTIVIVQSIQTSTNRRVRRSNGGSSVP